MGSAGGKIFHRIYLPLSRPAMIGAGLILFVFHWQAYLWPLPIAPNAQYRVAAVAVADSAGQYDVDFGQMFAAAVLGALIPMIVLWYFSGTSVRPLPRAEPRSEARAQFRSLSAQV